MAVNQRDVYLCPHPINPDSIPPHPFIVLSTAESNGFERTFLAVMITSSDNFDDDLSFDLTDDMFMSALPRPNSKARMHLIMLCINEDIRGQKVNEMREPYFRNLMKEIGSMVFNYSFKPI